MTTTSIQPADLRKDGTLYVFTLLRGTTVLETMGSQQMTTRKTLVFGEFTELNARTVLVWDCGITTHIRRNAILSIREATSEECE